MRRSSLFVAALWAATALPTWAGEQKVLSVTKDGLTIEGKIAKDEPKIKVTEPKVKITVDIAAKLYEVKLSAGLNYRIDLTSKDFEAILAVQDAAGKQVAFDDGGGGGGNSRLDFVPDKDGTYKIVACTLEPPGAFKLTIKDTGKAEAKKETKEPKVVAPKVDIGGLVKIKILNADIEKQRGLIPGVKTLDWLARLHEVKLEGGKSYQIDATPKDQGVDPILVIQDGAGKQLGFDDDGGGFPNSRFVLKTTKEDTYKIYVGTIGKPGRYVMTVQEPGVDKVMTFEGQIGGPAAPAKPAAKGVDVGAIAAAGVKLTDKLSNEVKAVIYQVKLEAGKTYIIDMMSPNGKTLDPMLKIVDNAGKLLAENDDIADGVDLNSRIEFRAPAAGVYRIVATSFGNVGNGEFTFQIKLKE